MIRLLPVVLSLCGLLGCATSAPKERTLVGDGTSISVGYRESAHLEPGYFVLTEKDVDQRWSVKRISQSPIVGRENDNQEVLYISKRRDFAQPFFERTVEVTEGFNGNTFQCALLLIDKKRYGPCTSDLTRVTVAASVGGNVVSALVTLGLASGYHVVVDDNRLLSVIESSNVFAAISDHEHQVWLAEYRSALLSATSSSDLDRFIARYSDNDPENLIPMAIEQRDNLAQMELAERQRLEAQEAARAKAEQEKRTRERLQIQAFRQSLAIGVETNCGPVIETRNDMVKIYSPVSGYGNEHWLRRDELFPHYFDCRFLNGRYQPPQPN